MSEGFVALTARRDKNRIAAEDGQPGRFSGMRTKSALPQNRLGIPEVALDEQLHFAVRGGEVSDGHLAAQSMEGVIAGGNDAAGCVEDEFAFRILFEAGENLIEDSHFLGEILRFAFEVSWTVRPTHPGGNAVDAGVSTLFKDGGEARFDLVVAADGRTSECGEIFCPMGFAGTGHADESEAQRLVRIGPHRELESVCEAGKGIQRKVEGGGSTET